MRRVQLLLLPVAAVGLLIGATRAGAADDAASGPAPTTVPGPVASGAPTTTSLGSPAPTSTLAPVPAPPRSGSAIGDLAKRDDGELWSIRQMATIIAAAVGGLAVLGYAYGRIRSYGT